MPDQTDHSGKAAFSICEAILLALNDHKVLPEHEIEGILRDAATTHENAGGTEAEVATHQAVANLIKTIIVGSNSVRRP